VPQPSGYVQVDDELIRYSGATDSMLVGCERGYRGTVAAEHESAIILFWPELAAEAIDAVKDSPNLWGHWVLDDSPGYARSALLALYKMVKERGGSGQTVCAGHSGMGTLRNFAPGTCDILAFYYYPFLKDRYHRTLNSFMAQWTLAEARRQVPGIPFLGVFQGFWESPESDRHVNSQEPMEPWQIREQIEDFVRDGAAGILGYAAMAGGGTFCGWNSRPELTAELRRIRDEIASTGGFTVPPEPEELSGGRIQPQGPWSEPRPIPGVVPAWQVIGPFDAGDRGFAQVFPPERELDFRAQYPGKGVTARWKTYPTVGGAIGLVEVYGETSFAEKCTAYAVCTVTSPREQAVQMRYGCDDDSIVWFNGNEIWRFEGGRGVEPDSDIVPVTLPAGETRILVKVYNRVNQWGIFMRFTKLDGNPLEGLTFQPSVPA
jgi:hypothetical protein